MKFVRFWVGGLWVLLMLLCKGTRLVLQSHWKVLWVLLGLAHIDGPVKRSAGWDVVDQEALKKFGG